jgi:phenylacetate-CoA ligase
MERILPWAIGMAARSPWFARAMRGHEREGAWESIPTMDRSDMQARLAEIVPADEPLDRLVVNPTSGTTGIPIPAPNHPRAVACYDPMIAYALERNGLTEKTDSSRVAAIQVCDQARTIAYHTVHSLLNGAGFAKVNIRASEWRDAEASARYAKAMEPLFLSGDPYAYLGAVEAGWPRGARILLSSALGLEPAARAKIEGHFGVSVAQLYSLNETGPVGYECPLNRGSFHVLPTDVLVETLDAEGRSVAAGERGEICVSGGRNPYLPLLRYRTGDSAILGTAPCACGEISPLLAGLEARALVIFDKPGGGRVNPVDIARIMRGYPIAAFRFRQARDLGCALYYDEMAPVDRRSLARELDALFGLPGLLTLRSGLERGSAKPVPFSREA